MESDEDALPISSEVRKLFDEEDCELSNPSQESLLLPPPTAATAATPTAPPPTAPPPTAVTTAPPPTAVTAVTAVTAKANTKNTSTSSDLLSVQSLLPPAYWSIIPYEYFNRVQSATARTLFLTDDNVVVSAPTVDNMTFRIL